MTIEIHTWSFEIVCGNRQSVSSGIRDDTRHDVFLCIVSNNSGTSYFVFWLIGISSWDPGQLLCGLSDTAISLVLRVCEVDFLDMRGTQKAICFTWLVSVRWNFEIIDFNRVRNKISRFLVWVEPICAWLFTSWDPRCAYLLLV